MDKTEAGERCKKHLTKMLGSTIDEYKLTCWPHKKTIQIYDIELFNDIARKNKISELNKLGGLHYFIDIPNNDNPCDIWIIALDEGLGKKLLNKYGNEYNLLE